MLNEITENRNDVSVTVKLSIFETAFTASSKKIGKPGLIRNAWREISPDVTVRRNVRAGKNGKGVRR
jgi:hypothetical protein